MDPQFNWRELYAHDEDSPTPNLENKPTAVPEEGLENGRGVTWPAKPRGEDQELYAHDGDSPTPRLENKPTAVPEEGLENGRGVTPAKPRGEDRELNAHDGDTPTPRLENKPTAVPEKGLENRRGVTPAKPTGEDRETSAKNSGHFMYIVSGFFILLVAYPVIVSRTKSGSLLQLFLVTFASLFTLAANLVLLDGWTCIEAVYICTQILTTIGYGDFYVADTVCAKLGISLFTVLFLAVPATAINKVLEGTKAAMDARMSSVIGDGDTDESGVRELQRDTAMVMMMVFVGNVFFSLHEACSCGSERFTIKDCSEATYEECVTTGGEVKGVVDAFYMSIITFTTVGFGDLSARTKLGRLFAIPWMVGGVFSVAMFITSFAKVFLVADEGGRFRDMERMDEKLFSEIDENGDGELSRNEFRVAMLLKYELVDRSILDMIDKSFAEVDRENEGSVSWEQVLEHQLKSSKH